MSGALGVLSWGYFFVKGETSTKVKNKRQAAITKLRENYIKVTRTLGIFGNLDKYTLLHWLLANSMAMEKLVDYKLRLASGSLSVGRKV